MAVNEQFSGNFYINVQSSFSGEIRSLGELAAMPYPTDNTITVGRVPNSQAFGSPAEFTYADSQTLGWTQAQWDLTYGTGGFGPIFTHWSGGTYWPEYRRHLIYGGGHAASGWNSLLSFNLNTMSWERVNNPSRFAEQRVTPYTDGTPPSFHSYHNMAVHRTKREFILPFCFYYDPTTESPNKNPGDDAGLFAWLPLGDIFSGTAGISQDINDLETNLYRWQTCWPYGFQNNGPPYAGNGAPNCTLWHENSGTWYQFGSHKPWTMDTYANGVHGPYPYPESGDISQTNIIQFNGNIQNSCKQNSGQCFNTIDNEWWHAFYFDSQVDGGGTQDILTADASQLTPGGDMDVTRHATTGDKPTYAYYTIGSSTGGKLEAAEHNSTLKWDSTNNRAIWWRPLSRTKVGLYRDLETGQLLSESDCDARSMVMTEITRDKVCRNLTINQLNGYPFPVWSNDFSPPTRDSCKSSPYGRFDYIEEFDVFIYVHNANDEVWFLKFPRPL